MKLVVLREVHDGEKRVAISPSVAATLVLRGFEVLVETDAGQAASFPDSAYEAVGATIVAGPIEAWAAADILVKVRPPEQHTGLGKHESELLREHQLLISMIWPAQNPDLVEKLAATRATILSMDQIPRITRAQKMDVLSSAANIAGYRAVVEAAQQFGSFFTGQMTAAGKVPPAKILVIGAGVAGLAAIGAARSLGGVVRAFDTRAAVKDQVKSLGGEFLEVEFEEAGEGAGGYAKEMSPAFIEAEMKLFAEQAREVDIVITTALIPGKPAPKLWREYMVEAMKPGSVVVDMAAEQGGNCDCTVPGEVVQRHGVSIVGYTDLVSRMANVASEMYGTNVMHLLDEMGNAEHFKVDHEDIVVRSALISQAGETLWPPPILPEPSPPPAPKPKENAATASAAVLIEPGHTTGHATLIVSVIALLLAGGWLYLRLSVDDTSMVAPATHKLLQHLTVFVLSVFVGWQIIWSVTPALHTPLMSVTNAISGIIIIGGMLQVGASDSAPVIIGAIATFFAAINIIGGFLVTQKMLRMFHK